MKDFNLSITKPFPLRMMESKNIGDLKAVFFDIDDTFSGGSTKSIDHARITDVAYHALWKLYNAGFEIIPVTGRPAGWCDHIVRMWPVSAVIGENGAFYLKIKNGRLTKTFLEEESLQKQNQQKLLALKAKILTEFPQAQLASDQAYREFDIAIDYCEDVKPWSEPEVDRLLEFCKTQGAMVKLSSIHVNTWIGKYDKLTCVRKYLKEEMGENSLDNVVYLGDSPNDEPFFKEVSFTVGVSNVKKFLPRMKYPPHYITENSSGYGFAEFVDLLIAQKKNQR